MATSSATCAPSLSTALNKLMSSSRLHRLWCKADTRNSSADPSRSKVCTKSIVHRCTVSSLYIFETWPAIAKVQNSGLLSLEEIGVATLYYVPLLLQLSGNLPFFFRSSVAHEVFYSLFTYLSEDFRQFHCCVEDF